MQFDILQAKEATFLSVDGCSERASEFSMPGYQLKSSDRSKLNWSIKEHRGMVEELNVTLKDLKEHDSTLFQSNGAALKQGKELSTADCKTDKTVEAKLTKVRQDMEALENKKRSYDSTFKGIHKQHIHQRRKKKRKPQKAN